MGFLTRGLEQLKAVPDLPDRIQHEISLLLSTGHSLTTTSGAAAPEVERVFARAHALCRQVDNTPQLLPVLFGLQMFYAVRGELHMACELAEQCLSLAQRTQDPNLLLWAHFALGQTLFQLGHLASSRTHLEAGIALYDPQHSCSLHPATVGSVVGCLCWLAFTLWALGYPDQALQRIQEAQTCARQSAKPYLLAIALCCAAAIHTFRRETQTAREQAEKAIAIATAHGFAQWLGLATVLQGWTSAEQGQLEGGLAQMHKGTTIYRDTGAELSLPYQLALLAEGCGKAGRIEEGLTAIAEALVLVNKSEARFSEAELYRLKGVLTLQSRSSLRQVKTSQDKPAIASPQSLTPDPRAEAEAEACFHKAIEIARRQSAKSLELRVVMSLSQLWQRQGKKDEARQMLAEIYGWFTEGFDTADLKEAQALLEEFNRTEASL